MSLGRFAVDLTSVHVRRPEALRLNVLVTGLRLCLLMIIGWEAFVTVDNISAHP